jgi:hypothetical protein
MNREKNVASEMRRSAITGRVVLILIFLVVGAVALFGYFQNSNTTKVEETPEYLFRITVFTSRDTKQSVLTRLGVTDKTCNGRYIISYPTHESGKKGYSIWSACESDTACLSPSCEDHFERGDTILVLNDISAITHTGFYAYLVRGGDTWESIIPNFPAGNTKGYVYYFSRKGKYLVKTFNINTLDVFPTPIHRGDILVFGDSLVQQPPLAEGEVARTTFYLPAEMVYGKKDIPIIPIVLGFLALLFLTFPKRKKRDRGERPRTKESRGESVRERRSSRERSSEWRREKRSKNGDQPRRRPKDRPSKKRRSRLPDDFVNQVW